MWDAVFFISVIRVISGFLWRFDWHFGSKQQSKALREGGGHDSEIRATMKGALRERGETESGDEVVCKRRFTGAVAPILSLGP